MNALPSWLTDPLDIWTSAETEKKSGRGRSSGNGASVYGIQKLRELILELAVRGKLVPQDPQDEPASELLKRIQAEKARLVAEGKIKKDEPLPPISDEEKPFALPQGWEWTKLGEITNFGVTEKLDFISSETWVLDLEDIEKDTSRLLQKLRFSERNSLSAKNSFQSGDVLYGKLRPYLNKVIVADEAGVCTTEILPVRCYGPFSSNYFKFVLKSPYFISYVNAKSYGMKMPRLGTEDGRKAYFPLPPLAEQHRIVAKVDELMALCDRLEAQHNNAAEAHEQLVSHLLGTLTQAHSADDFSASWRRIAAHFDTLFSTEASIDALKQTLLQLAVMGKLVPQDPDDEPASELLRRIQIEKTRLMAEGKIKKDKSLELTTNEERPLNLPLCWTTASVENVSECLDNLRVPINKEVREQRQGDVPYYGANGQVGWIDDYLFDEDLVLVVEDETFIARIKPFSYIVKGKSWVNNHAHVLRPLGGISVDYLNLCLQYYNFIPLTSGTTARRKLTQRGLMTAKFWLAPHNEQHRIVAKVDELMTLCDQLKSGITQAGRLQQKLADAVVEQAIAS